MRLFRASFLVCFLLLSFMIFAQSAEDEKKVAIEKRPVRKPVAITGVTEQNVFVGDEPITINYYIVSVHGTKIDEESFQGDAGQFAVVETVAGHKASLPDKDSKIQVLTRVVRPGKDFLYGAHVIPPLRVSYEYDEIYLDGDKIKKTRKIGEAASNSIKLEKVPLYVITNTLHEVVRIGDPTALTVSIRADFNTEVLNEFSPTEPRKGIVYLSNFSFETPIALLNHVRDEHISSSGQYRVIDHRYTYSILDIKPDAFRVPIPPVIWRLKNEGRDAGEVETKIISPAPVLVSVRSVLLKDSTFEPQKGVERSPSIEHLLFFVLPLGTALFIALALTIFGIVHLVRFIRGYRKRKSRRHVATATPGEEWEEPVYETSFWSRLFLRRALRRAIEAYNKEPNEVGCANLRELFARSAASHLRGDKRIDRKSVVGITATELEKLGNFRELKAIARLEKQLETRNYKPLEREER